MISEMPNIHETGCQKSFKYDFIAPNGMNYSLMKLVKDSHRVQVFPRPSGLFTNSFISFTYDFARKYIDHLKFHNESTVLNFSLTIVIPGICHG